MRQVFFRMPAGNYITIDIDDPDTMTLIDAQRALYKRTNLPTTRQRLIYNGRHIPDRNKTFQTMGWPHGTTVQVHVRWHGVGCACGWCTHYILLRNGKRVFHSCPPQSSNLFWHNVITYGA